jgi:uncharacterized protein YbbK (DUF523 family)
MEEELKPQMPYLKVAREMYEDCRALGLGLIPPEEREEVIRQTAKELFQRTGQLMIENLVDYAKQYYKMTEEEVMKAIMKNGKPSALAMKKFLEANEGEQEGLMETMESEALEEAVSEIVQEAEWDFDEALDWDWDEIRKKKFITWKEMDKEVDRWLPVEEWESEGWGYENYRVEIPEATRFDYYREEMMEKWEKKNIVNNKEEIEILLPYVVQELRLEGEIEDDIMIPRLNPDKSNQKAVEEELEKYKKATKKYERELREYPEMGFFR